MVAPVRRRLVSKVWLPTVVVVVVAVAGSIINSAQGLFGSDDRTRGSGNRFSIAQFNPKHITYEIFGDLNGWGRVGYWDVNSTPVAVDLADLALDTHGSNRIDDGYRRHHRAGGRTKYRLPHHG